MTTGSYHKKNNLIVSAREFLSLIPDYYLIMAHDFAVSLRPKVRRFFVSGPAQKKIHFFYCTCGKDFRYLTISLKSLQLLRLDCLGTIYIYVDKDDTLSTEQANELKDNFSFSMEIKISSKPLSWGGVKLLLFELNAFEEISRDISPHDYIFKVDSDVLFISDRIFKKVLSENYDAVGQTKPKKFMEGGSYFLRSALVQRIVRSPILKAIKWASTSWECPINQAPEDRAISKLVEQNDGKMLLCDYRIHGQKFRKLVEWRELDPYSIIHFSKFVNMEKTWMIKMWEVLGKKESLDVTI